MPIKRDYRDVQEPKITIREVMVHIINKFPAALTATDLSLSLKIDPHDASNRIRRLWKYGCLRPIGKEEREGRGRKPVVFTVTKWGFKCGERWGGKKKRKS